MEASSIFPPTVCFFFEVFAIVITLFTPLTPSTSLAYSVVRSFCAWLVASPRRVTIPPVVLTSVRALTFRLNRSIVFTFAVIHASVFIEGLSPLTSSLLSTLLTPGRLATVSWANDLWDSSETVPVKVTAPFTDWILISSACRYVLNTYDCLADDSMLLSIFDAYTGMLSASRATAATIITTSLYIVFIGTFSFYCCYCCFFNSFTPSPDKQDKLVIEVVFCLKSSENNS